MTDSPPGSVLFDDRILALAAEPDAPRWADQCGWVPGSGYCRNRDCAMACLFRLQREAERLRVGRSRQARRRAQRAFAKRFARLLWVLLSAGAAVGLPA